MAKEIIANRYWNAWVTPKLVTSKRTGKTREKLPKRASPDRVPGFLRNGRRFEIEESSPIFFTSGDIHIGESQFRVIEFEPVYKRRKRGEGNLPKQRLCWNYRSSVRAFKSKDQAMAWVERETR